MAPDLIVDFGDLAWRSLGSVGGGGWTATANDTGADDANHAWDGVFAMRDPRLGWGDPPLPDLQLLDVGATILDRAGLDPSAEIPGLPIGSRNERRAASTGFAAHA